MSKISYEQQENLAAKDGVKIQVSVPNPTGRGARDPHVLLNETAYQLNEQPLAYFLQNRLSTYDTYMGMQKEAGVDWYAIEFQEPTTFNCVDITMECAHRDGGWWTSLSVEIRLDGDEQWQPVEHCAITPDYCFDNVAYGRRPYETFSITFDEQTARAVRVIGQPGGLARFTSLARLGVYYRDLAEWDASQLPSPPTPYIFRLIQPSVIWDLSESLVKLTGLAVSVPTMDHYLDKDRYERWWKRISRNYMGEPELWYLVGVSVGWDEYFRMGMEYEDYAHSPKEPYVRIAFHNTLACAVAPIIIDGQVLGEMTSHTVILSGTFDEAWHRRYAHEHDIPWPVYEAAVERSPKMTYEQIEGAAALMGMIVSTITNLAHLNLNLKQELDGTRSARTLRAKERQEMVRAAIAFMNENLEAEISIEDIARTVALSPTYFGILFTEEMGRSPVKYLNALRIERAKQYLTHTDMSVLDVSVALGYNPNYFARFFRQHTGFTPSAYAEKMRQV